ncbi:hypothetical protein LEMLEM_LOCUS5232, partial [Lemmus lemmus]
GACGPAVIQSTGALGSLLEEGFQSSWLAVSFQGPSRLCLHAYHKSNMVLDRCSTVSSLCMDSGALNYSI